MFIKKILTTAFVLLFFFSLTACESEGPAEKAGEKVDEAVEETVDKAEEAAESMENKAEESKEKFE